MKHPWDCWSRHSAQPKKKDTVGVLEIRELPHGANWHADSLRQGHRGYSRDTYGFELSGRLLFPYSRARELVEIGSLERRAPGGVKHHRFRFELLQPRTDIVEGILPGCADVAIRSFVPA